MNYIKSESSESETIRRIGETDFSVGECYEWADWTAEGFEVWLLVDLDPPGAERPTDIFADYRVYDPNTGDMVFEREHRFNNLAQQDFERVSKKDMKFFRG